MNLKSGKKGKAWKDKKQPEPRPSNDGEFLIRPHALSDEITQLREALVREELRFADADQERIDLRRQAHIAADEQAEMAKEIVRLSEATSPDAVLVGKYHELIYEVATKFPNESRHDTALRYIRERENGSDNTPKQSGESKGQCSCGTDKYCSQHGQE